MGYITDSDIQTRVGPAAYVQLTDDTGGGVANETVVDEARAGAEGEVNAYLARRYAVPLQVAAPGRLVEVLDAQRNVDHVAQGALHRNQIDERRAGAELYQPELVEPALLAAAERAAVEGESGVQVADPEHHVIQAHDAH